MVNSSVVTRVASGASGASSVRRTAARSRASSSSMLKGLVM